MGPMALSDTCIHYSSSSNWRWRWEEICCKSYDLSVCKFWKQIGITDIGVSSLAFINGVEKPEATLEILVSPPTHPVYIVMLIAIEDETSALLNNLISSCQLVKYLPVAFTQTVLIPELKNRKMLKSKGWICSHSTVTCEDTGLIVQSLYHLLIQVNILFNWKSLNVKHHPFSKY